MSRFLFIPVLAIAAGVLFGYIGPTWSGPIAETKAAIALDDQALAAASEYTTQENSLATAQSAINSDNLARLSMLLPSSVDNVRLILDLNALAAKSGVSLSNIGVETPPAVTASNSSSQEPLGSVDITLSVDGSFSAFQTFLAGIERSQRLLDVQDVAVKGSDTGVYTYQMTIRLYWLR